MTAGSPFDNAGPSPFEPRHPMSVWIGPRPAELRRQARIPLAVGTAITALVLALLAWILITKPVPLGDALTVGAFCVLCTVPLTGGPWLFLGLTMLWQSRAGLVVTGTHLRTVGWGGGYELDLASTRSAVELIGGSRWTRAEQPHTAAPRLVAALHLLTRRLTRTRRDRLATYHTPYHPVLMLDREPDGPAIPVELCDLRTRQMRDPRETLLLAEIMATSPDPNIQHTAGQLRTIAGWRRLPHITDADPHAIPATPIGKPAFTPIIPTPVRAGTPAPEIQITSGA